MNKLIEKPISFGVIVTSRAFFSIDLAVDVRSKLLNRLNKLGFEYQIISHHLDRSHAALFLSLTVFMTALCNWLANRLDWLHIRYASLTMLLAMAYAALVTSFLSSHPVADYGWLLWPVSFAVYFKTGHCIIRIIISNQALIISLPIIHPEYMGKLPSVKNLWDNMENKCR